MNELGFISFIAPWYAQAIADLFTKVFDYHSTANEIQANPYEAAYSCSIILLLVTMLEGIAARAASISKELGSNEKFNALKYLEGKCSGIFSKDELKEIFVVRDSIVHSHLWETKASTDPESWMNILKRELSSSFGDFKRKSALDEASYRTRELQIEIIPAKMISQEAVKVFDIVINAIKIVDAHTNHIMGIDSCRIAFNKYEMNLPDFYKEVKCISQHQPSADR